MWERGWPSGPATARFRIRISGEKQMAAPESNIPPIDADELLAGIRGWVEIESPTTDAAAVNRMADRVQQDYRAIGAAVERVPGTDGFGDHLLVTSPWGGDGPGILV